MRSRTTQKKSIESRQESLLIGGKINSNFGDEIEQIDSLISKKLNEYFDRFTGEITKRQLTKLDDIKHVFKKIFCNNESIFKTTSGKCSFGGFKTVIICKKNSNNVDCKYVYLFDFKNSINSFGEDIFMENRKMDLSQYSDTIGASPYYFKKLIIPLYNNSRIRIDFMIYPNYGMELFKFLFDPVNKKFAPRTISNLALSFVFILTALYTFKIIHAKGITHRDLKPENINIGSKLIIIDFGLALSNTFSSDYFSFAGTTEYFTPNLANKFLDDSFQLNYDDYYDLDLHSIGINLINIMCLDIFEIKKNKFNNCPGRHATKDKNKQMCLYLLCHYKKDGTLGTMKRLERIIYNDPVYNELFNMLKNQANRLCNYGFKVYSKNNNSLSELTQMYDDIITFVKNNKEKIAELQNKIPVKLNKMILKDLEFDF